MAHRVSVFAGRFDLRWKCRNSAQHHCPPTSRSGDRSLMDPEDLELFQRSLRNATNDYTGEALDIALEDVGWRDAMVIEPRVAISTLFQLQGESNVSSSALS